jgi:hypothetical protein
LTSPAGSPTFLACRTPVIGSEPARDTLPEQDAPATRRLLHLKCKIKSLAVEAHIIRHEEAKLPGTSWSRHSLQYHRTWDVRREQRSSLIAYGYLRCKAYKTVEPNARTAVDIERVIKLVKKFGVGPQGFTPLEDKIKRWLDGKPSSSYKSVIKALLVPKVIIP